MSRREMVRDTEQEIARQCLGHLQAIVGGNYWAWDEDGPWCFFCEESEGDDGEAQHKPDCPYALAKAFLDSLS